MSKERVRVITEEQYKEYMELKNQTNKKVRRWKPEVCEHYYYVSEERRRVVQDCYTGFDYENNLYSFGNCFKTEEEVKKELDRRLVEQELLDMVDAKISDENEKWFIEYGSKESYFYPNNVFFRSATPFLFSSKESCQKVIDTLGTEKLKLIFRID